MRIGIDCRTILNPGFGEAAGVGHYTYYLVKNLLRLDVENEYVLFFDRRLSREAASRVIDTHPKAEARFLPFHDYRHLMPLAYSHFLVASALARERLDVYHLPAGNLPLAYTGKSVVTVHDLAIYRHPEWFPRQVLSTKVFYPKTIKSAAKIIAVSEHTKKDLLETFKIPAEKIAVVPEGVELEPHEILTEDIFSPADHVDREDLMAAYGIKEKYILFLGTIEPRKNISAALRAFTELYNENENFKNVDFVIAGGRGHKFAPIVADIKKAAKVTGGAVKEIGYVPSRDKFALMRYAEVFVYPSLYEGFGLPVLEAFAQGVPVITSNVSAIPEVAGDAAVLVNPNDFKDIKGALKRVLEDDALRYSLREKGLKRARDFSWERTAQKTLEVYRSV